MWTSLRDWCQKQWKAVLAFFGLAAAAAMMYIRSKNQKKILEYTNKSHKAETAVNEDATRDLVQGLEELSKEKDSLLDQAEENHSKKKKELDSRKKSLVDNSSKEENLESLAKDLADQIGADFVE